MRRGMLFVITAPSGCGKGTLRKAAAAEDPMIKFCPSVTTRAPRPGEVNGVDYIFITREEFVNIDKMGELAESADVYGNFYGTPRREIEKTLEAGFDVIIEKDVQGARALRRCFPDAIFVFILPPSMGELKRRMEARGTESPEQIKKRFDSARREISELGTFDYVIINSDVERAKERFLAIVAGERIRSGGEVRPPRVQRRVCNDEPTASGSYEKSRVQIQSGDCCRKKGKTDCQQKGADFSCIP